MKIYGYIMCVDVYYVLNDHLLTSYLSMEELLLLRSLAPKHLILFKYPDDNRYFKFNKIRKGLPYPYKNIDELLDKYEIINELNHIYLVGIK